MTPLLAGLLVIAYYVYTNLVRSTVRALSVVRVAGALGALVAGAGVLVGLLYSHLAGALLIIVAYYGELVLGVRLRDDLRMIIDDGVDEFIYGMLVFILFLPLPLFNKLYTIIPFIGNIVKTYGLITIYRVLSSVANRV